MASRRKNAMDIRELLRPLQANSNDRRVHRETGVHRLTVQHGGEELPT
jgi:hypothetical protein